MIREIKFRAWDKSNNCWLDLKYLAIDPETGQLVHAEDPSEYSLFDRSDYELIQYTGLKDKNGVEIYEGYVILTADDLRKQAVGNWKPKTRVVEWTDNKEYKTGFNLGRAQDGKCEVIGNIYENPELLDSRGGDAAD